ncbi:MAG: M16 family metallopeptidase [Acidobacteriota bacterium]
METGPVLIVEPMPGAAAAVGAWMRSGSAHEPRDLAGITHLLEHVLLRRCADRSPEAIAELIDSLGGAVDAFTSRESCAITAHVPADRLDEATSLVLDALFQPRFLAPDIELEQHVVDAEFDLVQDSPSEVTAEKALLACWGDHPLARPVLGQRRVVEALSPAELARFHRERFSLDRLVMVAVGPVTAHELEQRLSGLPQARWADAPLSAPVWRSEFLQERRDGLEQVYANLVLPGLPADHGEGTTLAVLHQLLGAGNSSRLFRELRDRLGLVYEVESGLYSTSVAGLLEITFSCPARLSVRCWDAVLGILGQVAAGAIEDREVDLAKQALLAGLMLGTEGSDALLEAHAGEFLARGRRFDAAVLRREIEEVTTARVRSLARLLVRLEDLAGAVCGPHGASLLPASLARRVA